MKRFTRFALLLAALCVLAVLPLTASASPADQTPRNPNANISYPPPIYVLSGEFPIRGSANLPNMTNYFIEFRPINEDVTQANTTTWAPATVPSRRAVQDDVLGVWDTRNVDDGAYEIRLTVNIRGGQPVSHIVTPLRVENNPPPFGVIPPAIRTSVPTATPTFLPPTPLPSPVPPTFDPTPRATCTSSRCNVRQGDSTNYPILASINQNQTVLILGISSRGTGWYQVRLPNGTIGWMAPSIVAVSGNLNLVPFVPPPPLPPTPTPIPTPTTPAIANLTAGLANIVPFPPVCGQQFSIGFDVANTGSTASFIGGTVTVQDIRVADGSVQAATVGSFPALGPGVTFRVNMNLTVNTFFNELHRLVLTIDPANQIAESNETDNVRIVEYVLQPGACGGGSAINLVAGNMNVVPFPPICNQQFQVTFDVANLGTAATTGNTTVTLRDLRAADGTQQGSQTVVVGPINPGQTINVSFNLTISTWFNETHRLVATIDPENAIAESNEGDNVRIVEYVLQQGGCA